MNPSGEHREHGRRDELGGRRAVGLGVQRAGPFQPSAETVPVAPALPPLSQPHQMSNPSSSHSLPSFDP